MADLVVFSPVQGQVLHNGAPVAGAVVERHFRFVWGDEEATDQVVTGPDGAFSLGVIQRRNFWASWLPHQPGIRQTVLIRHGGQVYKGWLHHKGDYLLNSEWGGRPARLVCRLEAEPTSQGDGFGICVLE